MKNRQNNQLIGSGILLLAALIWGMSFTAQSVGMEHIGPFTMNCARSVLGALTLLPVIIWRRVWARRNRAVSAQTGSTASAAQESGVDGEVHGMDGGAGKRRATLIGGVCTGVILAVASSLQQIGICYTTVGKAGFITTLYIVMVALTGVFRRKKVSKKVWLSVALAAVGIYLLCINEAFTVNLGDVYMFFCAIGFAAHILAIDHFSKRVDVVEMSCIQFFVCSVLCGAAMFLVEEPAWSNLYAARVAILYAGVMSTGIAFTLQIIGQKRTEPVTASMIMSLEAVFAALGGWLLLNQTLSARELLGCAVVFAGIILVQLPDRRRRV